MLSQFLSIFAPILALMALGFGLKYYKIFTNEHIIGLERFIFYVGFPALIVSSIGSAHFGQLPVVPIILVLCGAQTILALATMLGLLDKAISRPQFASILQCQVRWNSYFALGIAAIGYGKDGVTLMAIAVAAMVPFANIIAVWGFSRFGQAKINFWQELYKNPFIIATIIGVLVNVSDFSYQPINVFLQLLGQTTVALGLITVGAALQIAVLWQSGGRVVFWSLTRIIGLPLIAILLSSLAGIEGVARDIIIIATASPTATSGFVLAKKLGGDAPLMAMLICMTHVLGAVSLPVLWFIFRYG